MIKNVGKNIFDTLYFIVSIICIIICVIALKQKNFEYLPHVLIVMYSFSFINNVKSKEKHWISTFFNIFVIAVGFIMLMHNMK